MFEAIKGIAAAILSFSIWSVLHNHPAATANHVIGMLHLDHKGHPAHVLFHVLAVFVPQQFALVASLVVIYTAARLTEAYGLWHSRAWAEWFGIVSGAIYIPFELYEIGRHASALGVGVLVANVLVVGYLAYVRASSIRLRAVAPSTAT